MSTSRTREKADKVTFTQAEVTAGDTAARAGRKNLIINGGFDVAQRGTSFTAATGYTLDRWYMDESGATTTLTQETHTLGQTDVPNIPKNYLRMNTTTGANNCRIEHKIENVLPSSNQTMTLSFWAKGVNPASGAFGVNLQQNMGTGGSPSAAPFYPDTLSFSVTSSWVKKTVTFTLGSLAGKTLGTDNNHHIKIQILQKDADGGSAAWDLNISNIQLELGSVATDFEHRSYGEELRLCQRYFYRYQGTTQERIYNENAGATAKWWFLTFPEMRTTPTATFSSGWTSSSSIVVIGGTINSMSVGGGSSTAMSFRVTNSGSGGTVKSLYHTDGFSQDYCYLSAEL